MPAVIPSMILAALLAASFEMKGLRGETLRPLEPGGVANVLVFTATDCPVSNGYAPEIQRVCAASAAFTIRSRSSRSTFLKFSSTSRKSDSNSRAVADSC